MGKTWSSESSEFWQHVCNVAMCQRPYFQCQALEAAQVWEASLKELQEWLKAQNTFKPIREAVIQGLCH